MPYMQWKGITLDARVCKGMQFVSDEKELDALLFARKISLLSCKSKRIWWRPSVSLRCRLDYFMQLNMLLKAGLLLPDGLRLIAQQSSNAALAPTAYGVAQQVSHGISFGKALEHYPAHFNGLMMQMAWVGQESGNITAALQVLCVYLESTCDFRSRLRSVLLLPIMTFIFFVLIMAVLLIAVVPQFVQLFASINRELPHATKMLLAMSDFLRSWYMSIPILCLSMLYSTLAFYKRTKKGRASLDVIVMHIPYVNAIVRTRIMASFFQSVALLLEGGLPILTAFSIARESIDNSSIKNEFGFIQQEIAAGTSCADALAFNNTVSQDILSLIKIGQESGMLAQMFARAAQVYQQQLLKHLGRINMFFQPALLIILGLMITGLILALYTPIMSISMLV
jgi:type II secretory pathway component PulF